MTPDQEKLIVREIKFRAYVACGWGLLVLFALMGVVLGRPQGMIIGVIAAVMWVLNRMVREAFDGLRMLRGMKAEQAEQKKGDEEDKSPPPGPPSAA